MTEILSTLNPKQKEAVKYIEGPLLVIAGAGSGKTRVITQKIAYLIKDCGYDPKTITAITFTNKAAREMQERTQKILNNINTRGLTITTFHSLGLKILKEEAHLLNYKSNFSILDKYDSNKIISELITTTDKALVGKISNQISLWKNQRLSPEQALGAASNAEEMELAKLYRQYQDTIKAYHAVDFDDLLKLPLELFENNLEVLYKWQQKIQYLLIDEYQDTNECQYQLIKAICARSKRFTAVGDDDQSIYAWRGANINNLTNLQTDFPKLHTIKLEQNYRSTITILNAANNVIKNNPKLFSKKLWSEFGYGEPIKIVACISEEGEAEIVARKIMLHQLQYQSKLSDYAILYRGNHQSRIIEEALRNYQLPYTVSGGQSFFAKSEIKDISSYLRLLVNEDDDSAFIRAATTPKRGIGSITMERLTSYARSRKISLFEAMFEEGFAVTMPAQQLDDLLLFGNFINNLQFRIERDNAIDILNDLITGIKYEAYLYEQETSHLAEKKWNNVLSLINWMNKKVTEDNKTLPELIQNVTLISMLDNNESSEINAINLSTLHAAKGLEFPYVYMVSCEEGIIPHHESLNQNMVEEERRLMYVGITRAQKELTLSYCLKRKQAGETSVRERSRFLNEIGDNNIIDEARHAREKITDSNELQDRLKMLQDMLK